MKLITNDEERVEVSFQVPKNDMLKYIDFCKDMGLELGYFFNLAAWIYISDKE